MADTHRSPASDDNLAAIAVLQEPVRRSLYRYVVGQPDDVSRDQAAAAVGVQRPLAAFHLDKLVEAGLLETTFRRLTGRTGPGAGRPAKLYRRSSSEHHVSLPPRQYELAAELLARAVVEAADRPARQSLAVVARRFGRRLGEELRSRVGPRAGRERRLAACADLLQRHGYEPRHEGSELRLANCPFHALAENHRELVCGMNRSLLEGVLEGMAAADLEALPNRPAAGECCMVVSAKRRKS